MDPRKDSGALEGSAESGSNDKISNAESSAEHKEPNDNPASSSTSNDHELTTSSGPAILEPSEDEPLFKRERIRPFKTYNSIMRSFNSTEIYVNSDDPSNNGENEQRTARYLSVFIDLYNHYRNFAIKLRNSKLVYILQKLLILLPLSAIWMGIKYSGKCPGSPGLIEISGFNGMLALVLISQWIAIKCCIPDDRPCEGYQKFLIFALFLMVSGLLELEIFIFCNMSPSFESSTINYCSKTFYDYTYYKFIAAFGSIFLVVLLYFPNYSSFASDVTCANPITNSCYEGIEDSE